MIFKSNKHILSLPFGFFTHIVSVFETSVANPSVIEMNGIGASTTEMYIKTKRTHYQQCVFPETTHVLLTVNHRPHGERFSLERLPTKQMIH